MAATAEKSDPALWDKVKTRVTRGDKGGKPGQWSARKAQLATAEYKKQGGGYKGKKTKDNHLQEWTEEEWGTKSGRESGETGERYLPKKARKAISAKDYARTTEKKRADTRRGKQFSAQPKDVAKKTARARTSESGDTKPPAPARRKAGTKSATAAKGRTMQRRASGNGTHKTAAKPKPARGAPAAGKAKSKVAASATKGASAKRGSTKTARPKASVKSAASTARRATAKPRKAQPKKAAAPSARKSAKR